MTEYVMQNGVLVPGTSRRTFMKVLGTLFTGAVVAPVIVPYKDMMHIDSPTNKLVFAFTTYGGYGLLTPSYLNLGDCLDPIVRAQWEGQNPQNRYEFVRQGAIHPSKVGYWGAHAPFTTPEAHADSVRRLKNRIDRFRAGESFYI